MSERDREVAEEGRVEAETERQEHETLRRTAEGGPANPDDLEQGRVEAEEGRAAAETVRIEAESVRVIAEDKRASLRDLAIAIAPFFAFLSLIPSLVGLYLVNNESNQRCQDSQLNRQAIRDTVLNSFAALGYRYDEKTKKAVEIGGELAYYKEHPGERADALERTLAAVERFPPISC